MLNDIVFFPPRNDVKYTVLYLFVQFSNTFLYQINVCNVIHLVAGNWFMAYNSLTTTKILLQKIYEYLNEQ